jgi:hypothetical protein
LTISASSVRIAVTVTPIRTPAKRDGAAQRPTCRTNSTTERIGGEPSESTDLADEKTTASALLWSCSAFCLTYKESQGIVAQVTSDIWLSRDDQFRSGEVLFRSDRTFQLWAYGVTHSQLLLSSNTDRNDKACKSTVQILFKPVEAVQIQECYRGLVISCATEAETRQINAGICDYGFRNPSARVFVLESQGVRGYVVSSAIGWREGVLSRLEPSFFNSASPYDPAWPIGPLGGTHSELEFVSITELTQALIEGLDDDDDARRDRRRYVYVLLAKDAQRDSRPNPVGVFLTEADAEEAARLLRSKVSGCRVEAVAVVL